MIWVLGVLVILLWYAVVQYMLGKGSTPSTLLRSQLCPSPDCLRCSAALKATYSTDVSTKLKRMYDRYESLAVHKIEERLTFDVGVLPAARRPTVCFLRNMCSDAWHNHKQSYLQDILTDSYSVIKTEVASAMTNHDLWNVSDSCTQGSWKKLFLYNQGKKIDKNCRDLPKTTQMIEGLDTFMGGVVFGNAFLSVLDGTSSIEPHCGPTNLRVRCHLGLLIPTGDCSLTVNGEVERWSNQSCILFDDSFLHSARNMTSSQRIILIVDIWHPNLTITEIKILGELFAVKEDH